MYHPDAAEPGLTQDTTTANIARAAHVPASGSEEFPIVVLQSLRAPDGNVRFITQMLEGAPRQVRQLCFSWKTAFLGRYDVFHVHWPEFVFRPHRLKALVLLMLLRVWHKPIVRTLHNVAPHEKAGAFDRWFLRTFDRSTALFVTLNSYTPIPVNRPVIQIPHGHYRDCFAKFARPAPQMGRILFFGQIRPYKRVHTLISAFLRIPEERAVSLRLVGLPRDDTTSILEAERIDRRISSRLEYVTDQELIDEISKAELVVLPYAEMHNSGALLLALSLERPVLTIDSPETRELAAEIGSGWIMTFEGTITPGDLCRSLELIRLPRATAPHFQGREWDVIGTQYHDAYKRVLRG